MLQSLESQRVGHDLVTEQLQHPQILVYYIYIYIILSLVWALFKVTQVTSVNVKVEYEAWNVEFSKM